MAIKASWVLQNRRYPLPGRQAFGLAGAPSLCRRGIISRFGIGVSGNEHHLARTQCLHRGYSEEFKRKITPHGVGHIVRRKLGLKTPSRTNAGRSPFCCRLSLIRAMLQDGSDTIHF